MAGDEAVLLKFWSVGPFSLPLPCHSPKCHMTVSDFKEVRGRPLATCLESGERRNLGRPLLSASDTFYRNTADSLERQKMSICCFF